MITQGSGRLSPSGLAIFAVGLGLLWAAVLADWHAVIRIPLVLIWVLVVPGWAWARRLPLGDRTDTLAVGVAISVALLMPLASVMALTGLWLPSGGLAVLCLVAAVGVLLPSPWRGERAGDKPGDDVVEPDAAADAAEPVDAASAKEEIRADER